MPADEGYVVTAAEVFERMVKNMEARRAKEPWNKNRFAQNPYEMLDVKIEDSGLRVATVHGSLAGQRGPWRTSRGLPYVTARLKVGGSF